MRDVTELQSVAVKGDTAMGRKHGAWMERRAAAFQVASARYFKAQREKAKKSG